MSIGFLYTYVGLVLFLTGVNIGFAPVGSLFGSGLAESSFRWLLVPIGIVIGYYIVKAEPAVQVLNEQVEEITGGTVSHKMMNAALSLAMVRVLTGLNIYWIIIPGYIISLIFSHFVPPVFVGIAFDSGGVASGPMTSTFLLPLAIGACTAIGGNVVTDAFGIVALVALAPLIAMPTKPNRFRSPPSSCRTIPSSNWRRNKLCLNSQSCPSYSASCSPSPARRTKKNCWKSTIPCTFPSVFWDAGREPLPLSF